MHHPSLVNCRAKLVKHAKLVNRAKLVKKSNLGGLGPGLSLCQLNARLWCQLNCQLNARLVTCEGLAPDTPIIENVELSAKGWSSTLCITAYVWG